MKQTFSVALSALALILGLSVVAPLASSAQPAPSYTPVPMAKADFSSMNFLMGNWTCTQMLRGKSRPDMSTTTMGMDGAWMVTQDTAPPFDAFRTATIAATTYTGYDPTTKMWIQTGVDSSGAYFTSTSPGWDGSTITWTTKGLDGSSGTDVVTKVNDTQTSDDSSNTDAKGTMTKTTIACKKTS
jgi:hypothetical protein